MCIIIMLKFTPTVLLSKHLHLLKEMPVAWLLHVVLKDDGIDRHAYSKHVYSTLNDAFIDLCALQLVGFRPIRIMKSSQHKRW